MAALISRGPATETIGDLYERFHAQIFGFCLGRLGSREEAEDATQSTFLNALRGLQRGVRPDFAAAWLYSHYGPGRWVCQG